MNLSDSHTAGSGNPVPGELRDKSEYFYLWCGVSEVLNNYDVSISSLDNGAQHQQGVKLTHNYCTDSDEISGTNLADGSKHREEIHLVAISFLFLSGSSIPWFCKSIR